MERRRVKPTRKTQFLRAVLVLKTTNQTWTPTMKASPWTPTTWMKTRIRINRKVCHIMIPPNLENQCHLSKPAVLDCTSLPYHRLPDCHAVSHASYLLWLLLVYFLLSINHFLLPCLVSEPLSTGYGPRRLGFREVVEITLQRRILSVDAWELGDSPKQALSPL